MSIALMLSTTGYGQNRQSWYAPVEWKDVGKDRIGGGRGTANREMIAITDIVLSVLQDKQLRRTWVVEYIAPAWLWNSYGCLASMTSVR